MEHFSHEAQVTDRFMYSMKQLAIKMESAVFASSVCARFRD